MHRRNTTDEQLRNVRHARATDRTERRRIDRNVAPRDHFLVQRPNRFFGDRTLRRASLTIAREKNLSDSIVTDQRKLDVDMRELSFEKCVRDLNQNSRAVARFGIAAGRSAMREAPQNFEPLLDDVVPRFSAEPRDEAEPARVVLERGVVQAAHVPKYARK
jgi:hypothetical protein